VNPGAAFGQLDTVPWLLVIGRACAAVFLITLVVRSAKGRPLFNTALVLVLAGALGNLYDNLLRARVLDADQRYTDRHFYPFGPVRDFIDVYFSSWHWHFPTFNFADSCISVGAAVLLACGLFGGKHERERASAEHAPRA
jgi:signal peptidase II